MASCDVPWKGGASLKDARDKARELLGGVKIHDRDPMAERKAARTARRKEETATFAALSLFYVEEYAKRRAEYVKSGKGTPPPGAEPLPEQGEPQA